MYRKVNIWFLILVEFLGHLFASLFGKGEEAKTIEGKYVKILLIPFEIGVL